MAKAEWKGVTIAESDSIEIVEGNVYFPPDSLNREYLQESNHSTTCPWKGRASYYHVAVSGARNENAAWYYPEPKDAAQHIKDHVAFWRGVKVEQ
ncbi:MAG: DUF427 domain-containing protein [Gemmatimonadota bacterium]|nr:DUF427 domain-containing protein [Gemmatimonadota bacterium]